MALKYHQTLGVESRVKSNANIQIRLTSKMSISNSHHALRISRVFTERELWGRFIFLQPCKALEIYCGYFRCY